MSHETAKAVIIDTINGIQATLKESKELCQKLNSEEYNSLTSFINEVTDNIRASLVYISVRFDIKSYDESLIICPVKLKFVLGNEMLCDLLLKDLKKVSEQGMQINFDLTMDQDSLDRDNVDLEEIYKATNLMSKAFEYVSVGVYKP
ncbi:MAG: hypothetical protein CL760_09550 [Chloroflexi bacterium]|nr:hypothetical protein [Chloroflexota bacterium]|tara:strand:- start:5294 stop:5734 length:441 start_codon:yes stop_codon:yes gene_type:complete